MAKGPWVIQTYVGDRRDVDRIRRAAYELPGVESVYASPEHNLLVVHGPVEPWRLIMHLRRKLNKNAEVVSNRLLRQYGTLDAYSWAAAHPQPPSHTYYPQPPPHQGHPYAARGYHGWVADPAPYGHQAYSKVPTCSIL